MKKKFCFFLVFQMWFCSAQNKLNSIGEGFNENKGQITDQDRKVRRDILFSGNSKGFGFFLKRNGFSYQLIKKKSEQNPSVSTSDVSEKLYDVFRLDAEWLNSNKNTVVEGLSVLSSYNNYYSDIFPDGCIGVKQFGEVLYHDLYTGVDLMWYMKDGNLKYDYIVDPGVDYKQIKLVFKGAKLTLNERDELVITTPLGEITECKPVAFQKGHVLKTRWIIEDNIVSFKVEDYDARFELIIDPEVRHWGTYYGGLSVDTGEGVATDSIGNVFMVGQTDFGSASMITAGAHQTVYTGNSEGFIVKFNSNGVRQWGTYYGQYANDYIRSCTTDPFGNLIIAGSSSSSLGIATPGSHQPVLGGGSDAFVAKFNTNGIRQWGTHYGDVGNDYGWECRCDKNGNIYLAGQTAGSGGTAIATPGTHQTMPDIYASFDAFLVKFNNNGQRIWGTYYGGDFTDIGYSCSVDTLGNVYLCGSTNSSSAIATVGAHQVNFGSINTNYDDGFLVKFDSNGSRLWGTYYGGGSNDHVFSCVSDAVGNVYIGGATSSGSAIATPGSYQTSFGSSFFVKFNPAGQRQWGTYYGGGNSELVRELCLDKFSNLYVAGSSVNVLPMLTVNGFEYWGGNCAFLAKFSINGIRKTATAYGSSSNNTGNGCTVDNLGNSFLTGNTDVSSGTSIASPNGHKTTFGNTSDAYLVKFYYCPDFTVSIASMSAVCPGQNNGSATVSVTGGIAPYTYSWMPSGSTVSPVYNLTNGTNTVIIRDAAGCSAVRTVSMGYQFSNPVLTITPSSPSVCANSPATLTASGAQSYTWSNNQVVNPATVSPSVATTYTVIGLDGNGCVGTKTIVVGLYNTPIIAVNSGTICEGSNFMISPFGTYTYTIQGGNNIVSPTVTTSYSIVGASFVGCISNTVICTVTVLPAPNLTASATPSTLCAFSSSTLSAGGVLSYTWNNGVVNSSFTTAPSTSTFFTVTGKGNNGCQKTVTVSLVTYPPPFIDINTTHSILCMGESATLTADGATSYTWINIGNSPTIIVTPSVSQTYTVVSTDLNGCQYSSFFTQIVTVCTGVFGNDAGVNKLEVFPNPSNGILFISGNKYRNNIKAEIIDGIGEKLEDFSFNESNYTVNLYNYVNGIYLLKLYYKSETSTTKEVYQPLASYRIILLR